MSIVHLELDFCILQAGLKCFSNHKNEKCFRSFKICMCPGCTFKTQKRKFKGIFVSLECIQFSKMHAPLGTQSNETHSTTLSPHPWSPPQPFSVPPDPSSPEQHISRPHGALLYATSPHLNVSRPGRGAARAAATLLSPGGGARGGGGGRAA